MKKTFRIIKLSAIVLIGLVFIGFAAVNTQTLYIQLPLIDSVFEVRQYIALFIAMIFGLLINYLYNEAKTIGLKLEIKTLKNKVKALDEEVDGLKLEGRINKQNSLAEAINQPTQSEVKLID